MSFRGWDMMTEVRRLTTVDPKLYAGCCEHAADRELLQQHGITAVCNLTNDDYADYTGSTVTQYLKLGQDDSKEVPSEKIARFLQWMDERDKDGAVVLVHCQMGISRTAAFIIAWRLHQFKANRDSDLRRLWSRFLDALGAVRPCIDPHWQLTLSVLRYFEAR